MKPYILAAGDRGYCEAYGPALEQSAKRFNLECQIECNGKTVGEDCSKAEAMAFKYIVLPDVLHRHGNVLLLDLDSIIRKPIDISDWWGFGVVMRDDSKDAKKVINGGCVYFTRQSEEIAWRMKDAMRDAQWFKDQKLLLPFARAANKRMHVKVFQDDFFSWRFDDRAAIWTGKGDRKNDQIFQSEMEKYAA